MNVNHLRHAAALTFLVFAIAACGGGGGGGGSGSGGPGGGGNSGNSAPRLTGPVAFEFFENAPVQFQVAANDPDGDTVTVQLAQAGDGAFFSYNAGSINSSAPFNFEAPQDANGDNVYELSLTLSDGKTSVAQQITVTITNADDLPTCSLGVRAEFPENRTGLAFTFDGNDEDGPGSYSELLISPRPIQQNLPNSAYSALRLDQTSGEVFVDVPLDSEDFEPGVAIFLQTSYLQGGQLASCTAEITITDVPSIVTSGIKLNVPASAVENAGDLDADGFDELWLPAPRSIDVRQTEASGHLIYGRVFAGAITATGAAELSLSGLSPSDTIRIYTTEIEDVPTELNGGGDTLIARFVADLDGDSLPELLIGQRVNGIEINAADPGRGPAAYLLWGSTLRDNTSGQINLGSLAASDGIVIRLASGSQRRFLDMTSADFDGDGLPEIVIGQPEPFRVGNNSFVQTQIIFGPDLLAARASGQLDLTDHPGVASFFGSTSEVSGRQVVSIGDITGDGRPDLVVSASQSDLLAVLPGQAISDAPRGVRSSFWQNALYISGTRGGILNRRPLDINGDAIPDILFTAVSGSLPGASLVRGALVRSQFPMPAGQSLTISDASSFTRFVSEAFNRDTQSLTSLGDLNGDGRDEIAIGGWRNNTIVESRVFVIMGDAASAASGGTLDMTELSAGQGIELTPARLRDVIDRSVTSFADINGDGAAELVILVLNRGQVYILLSSDIRAAVMAGNTALDLGIRFEFEP